MGWNNQENFGGFQQQKWPDAGCRTAGSSEVKQLNWFPTWRKLKTWCMSSMIGKCWYFFPMANTHARPGPILSGRTRSCKKSYTRKSDYAQWVGGVGAFGAKNPMNVFKKVGGFWWRFHLQQSIYTRTGIASKPVWIDGWTIPENPQKKGMVVEGWCGWNWNYGHFELIPSRKQTWQWEWEIPYISHMAVYKFIIGKNIYRDIETNFLLPKDSQ